MPLPRSLSLALSLSLSLSLSDNEKVFRVSLAVSPVGAGELEFRPELDRFETAIPDLVILMAQACDTLPALGVAPIDNRFHEDPLLPVFPILSAIS